MTKKKGSNDGGNDKLLDAEIDLGPLGGPGPGADFEPEEMSTIGEYRGSGDLWGEMGSTEGKDKKVKKGEIRSTVEGISADLPPLVLVWFYSWDAAHRDMFPGASHSELMGRFIVDALFRDVKADVFRPADEHQYDPQYLYLDGLMPLIEAEVRVREEEIAAGVRLAIKERLEAMYKQGIITEDVLVALEAAGGMGND
jgi:hypothetical protein